jgi:hypothetical protein
MKVKRIIVARDERMDDQRIKDQRVEGQGLK